MTENNLRHMESFVESVLSAPDSKDLLRKALEAALAALMEGEVSELAQAGYRERTADRVNHRNGYRERRFDSALGTSSLQIPRLRQGSYMPSFLKARQRSDEALMLAMASCYHQGVSTRNAEAVARALGVENLSRSTASRMAAALDPQVEAFRRRSLPGCPYVYLDARYEHVREDHAVRKMAVMVALGVRVDGGREVLGFQVARVENQAFWDDFIADLVERGLTGTKLVVSDAHEGLRRAIEQRLPAAAWQRCKVHYLRNLGSRLPPRRRSALLSLAKTIFEQETLEDALKHRATVARFFREARQAEAAEFLERADEVLTHMQFPREHWTKLHSTNLVERLNRELKRRTRVVSIFPHRGSLERLVGALLVEEHEEWMVGRRYISEKSMKLLQSPVEQLDEIAPGAGALLAPPLTQASA